MKLDGPAVESKRLLWIGAAFTAASAIFFPRIQGIRDDDSSWWRLLTFFVAQDREGWVLVPLVIALTAALFALVGGWAWRDARRRNRPAKVGLVTGVLGFAGIIGFFLSAPILLGGLGVTLGIEGRRRRATEGRGVLAVGAIVAGTIAYAIGASMWIFAEELGL
ncbi:MAG: hypothetical protein ICV64_00755 [Thermoleophilia bacterium]|nr:hypothetical protein [Thermoleophilia bacterium]